MAASKPRVLLLWHSLTGYSAAAIRALAERAEVTVLAARLTHSRPTTTPHWTLAEPTCRSPPYPWPFTLLDESDRADASGLIPSPGRDSAR